MSGYATPDGYSKSRIDKSVRVLRENSSDEYPFEATLEDLHIIKNWRASHALPLDNIHRVLAQKVRTLDKGTQAFTSYRLKRIESTQSKLARFPQMRFSRIQDIGGCRAVMGGSGDVTELEKRCRKAMGGHKLIKDKDYIRSPKSDGYRGIHLVFEFKPKHPKHEPYRGMMIEVQIRTKLQHIWSTAVETAGLFNGVDFKSGHGEKGWRRFFELMSSIFAISDSNTSTAPKMPEGFDELSREVRALDKEHQLAEKLLRYSMVETHRKRIRNAAFYLITIDLERRDTDVREFTSDQSSIANEEYLRQEEAAARRGKGDQVVLVSVDDVKKLEQAYPNYFFDIHQFAGEVDAVIKGVAS